MKIERMEVVGINVKSLDKAMKVFSDVLGIKPVDFRFGTDVHAKSGPTDAADGKPIDFKGTRIAIDPTGYLELIETDPATETEGLRNVHFKVTDIAAAKAELQAKGIRVIADTVVGGLKEVIFHPDDLHGVRLCLIEYTAPSMIEALLQK